MNLPDIDIDTKDRNEILKVFDGLYTDASMLHDGVYRKHPSGVFFQEVPIDPFTGFCAFPSGKKSNDVAETKGLVKLDIINNSAYEHVDNYHELGELLDTPVDWAIFDDKDVVEKLQHINNHYDIVWAYRPTSIEDLACLIALIRPAKRYLVGEDWKTIREKIWLKEGEEYAFKKSHAFGFALMIIVQLNSLIKKGLI